MLNFDARECVTRVRCLMMLDAVHMQMPGQVSYQICIRLGIICGRQWNHQDRAKTTCRTLTVTLPVWDFSKAVALALHS